MTEKSDQFEHQVKRIHSLIEGDDAVVTWNDRLPDPDNPAQARQIDVTIKKDAALTLVECRIHAEPQDVTWIEELIGRRTSLNADTVIAVSASGFSKGAILKAKAFGIVLRDFASLTEQEICAWGHRTDVSVELHHFKNVALTFTFAASDANRVSVDDVEQAIKDRSIELAPIFDKLVEAVRDRHPSLPPTSIEGRITPKQMVIAGKPVLAIDVVTDFISEERKLLIPTVVAYDIPDSGSLERNTYVEMVENGQFEITQSSDHVAVAMDIAAIPVHHGAKLGRLKFKFTRPVEVREVNLLGQVDLGFWLGPLDLAIVFK